MSTKQAPQPVDDRRNGSEQIDGRSPTVVRTRAGRTSVISSAMRMAIGTAIDHGDGRTSGSCRR